MILIWLTDIQLIESRLSSFGFFPNGLCSHSNFFTFFFQLLRPLPCELAHAGWLLVELSPIQRLHRQSSRPSLGWKIPGDVAALSTRDVTGRIEKAESQEDITPHFSTDADDPLPRRRPTVTVRLKIGTGQTPIWCASSSDSAWQSSTRTSPHQNLPRKYASCGNRFYSFTHSAAHLDYDHKKDGKTRQKQV